MIGCFAKCDTKSIILYQVRHSAHSIETATNTTLGMHTIGRFDPYDTYKVLEW